MSGRDAMTRSSMSEAWPVRPAPQEHEDKR